MSRVYDIVSRLENGNQKPQIKVDAEHEFTINNSKAAALTIMSIEKDKKLNDVEKIDKLILVALGKEASEYIEKLELSMSSYTVIVNAIMAAIADVSLEEMEEEAKKQKAPRG